MFSRRYLSLAACAAVMLAACGQAPVDSPQPAPAIAPTAAVEPGRQSCGPITLVLPEGASQYLDGEPEVGLVKIHVYLPNGPTLDIVYVAGQESAPTYAEDESVRAQTERWLESAKASMAADWTPEIKAIKEINVSGYYTVVKHDPESKPPNEYVRDLWPKKRYTLQGFFNVGGQVIHMGGAHDDDTGAFNERLVEVIKTAKWAH